MKKEILIMFFGILLLGCNRQTPEEKIQHLNGYWEIKQAGRPEGITKEFRYSEMVDYIQTEDSAGFRKKVRPQLDGSFITSDDVEKFRIKVENDSINLYYSTPYAEWKETLISSEENKLMILNQDGIIYTYERFTPYSGNYGEEN